MIYAFINNDRVEKIEDVEEDVLNSIRQNYQHVVDISLFPRTPKVGWTFENMVCYPNLPNVTPRQLRQALILSGVNLGEVQTALYGLPYPLGALATAEWEYSISFNRRRPLVMQVASNLGWTEDQLDDLWILAGSFK